MHHQLKKMKRVIIAVLLFSQTICFGQSNDRTDFQTWSDLTFYHYFTNRVSMGGDVGLRGIVSSKDWNLIYVRPTVHYTHNSTFKFSGGIGSFNTFNKTSINSYELRFFQDIYISWPSLGWIDFRHRIRFEERLFFYPSEDNAFSVRGRYLLSGTTINFKFIGKRKGYYLKAMWEPFFPLGESAPELFVNNQRIYGALGYQASSRLRFELFYIWQKSREFADDGFKTTENVVRFRAFYILKLPEK